jgi:hypothetical protein
MESYARNIRKGHNWRGAVTVPPLRAVWS